MDQSRRKDKAMQSESQSACRQLEKNIFSAQRLLAKQYNGLLEGHLHVASI
jgi:hypothetical protein